MDSASLVIGDQEDRTTSSLTWLRTMSATPAKDQLWMEGVFNSCDDMGRILDGEGKGGGG